MYLEDGEDYDKLHTYKIIENVRYDKFYTCEMPIFKGFFEKNRTKEIVHLI